MSRRRMNNKWPKAPIIYNGRALRSKNDRVGVDVKNFITTNDEMLNKIIKKNNLDKGNNNKIAHNCQQFVVNFLDYKRDKKTSNCPEFWQFPFESLHSQIGDCEDGAILMASLMIQSGIPSWRVKVAAGEVKPGPNAPTGGHAYCIYYANKGIKKDWVIMDWCFYEDSNIRPSDKPSASEGGQKNAYKKIWFTFNNEYSWNQEEIEAPTRIADTDLEANYNSSGIETVIDKVQLKINSQ